MLQIVWNVINLYFFVLKANNLLLVKEFYAKSFAILFLVPISVDDRDSKRNMLQARYFSFRVTAHRIVHEYSLPAHF